MHTNTCQLEHLSDQTLIKQVAGNPQAFESLVKKYHAQVFNSIIHVLNDYDLSWDVTQHVFLQLYVTRPEPPDGKSLKSWLLQVAHNRCIDEKRKQRAVHFSDLDRTKDGEGQPLIHLLPDPRPSPEELVERNDLYATQQQAIQNLPPHFRSVVQLRYTTQLTFSEIGKQLNLTEVTARSYFHKARPLLRAALA